MNITKIKPSGKTKRFYVKGASIPLMNAVRRTVMNSVPVLAIEELAIYENDSVMFDEMVAHRLAMVPLKTDSKSYKKGDKLKILLEKEGPGTVYSGDLESTDPKIEVGDKKIPITKLKKGQKIKLEATAVMETGKEHSKWQPAIISYKQVAEISNSKDCNKCGDCINICPRGILEEKAGKIVLKDKLECTLCGECRDVCKKKALELSTEEGSFLLSIEPSGALSSKETVKNAVEVLEEKIKDFRKEVKKLS